MWPNQFCESLIYRICTNSKLYQSPVQPQLILVIYILWYDHDGDDCL